MLFRKYKDIMSFFQPFLKNKRAGCPNREPALSIVLEMCLRVCLELKLLNVSRLLFYDYFFVAVNVDSRSGGGIDALAVEVIPEGRSFGIGFNFGNTAHADHNRCGE